MRSGLVASRLVLGALAGLAPLAAAQTLVPFGATWSYRDDGSDQGSEWRMALDPNWASGPAQLGYGEGDEATTIGGGPPGPGFTTAYFVHEFEVADPNAIAGLKMMLLRDDGAVVYLNGNEVVRDNLPFGPIDSLTRALFPHEGMTEGILVTRPVDPGLLVSGTNLLAAEIHQADPTSPDCSFDLDLSVAAAPPPPALVRGPYLQIGTPSSVVVRWRTDESCVARVSYGTSPGDLTQEMTLPAMVKNHEVQLSGLQPATTYFYEIGTPALALAGADPNHFFVTSPPPGSNQPTRIWVIGDSGLCGVTAQGCSDAGAVRDAYLDFAGGEHTDVWLMLGDNAYNDGTDVEYTAAVFDTFPQVEGLRFTHRWGGIIASTTRFCMAPGVAFGGRVAWSIGYTGLGVSATRFGARVGLELLGYDPTEILDMHFVRKRPLPWPPEPLRWIGVTLTRNEMARADRNNGKRGLWLELLDKLNLGFAC